MKLFSIHLGVDLNDLYKITTDCNQISSRHSIPNIPLYTKSYKYIIMLQ